VKIKNIHVKNYKCVEDSEEFSVNDVTCLVGKNESGKTAVLEAIYRLNPYYQSDSTFNKDEEYPRRFLADYDERHPTDEAIVIETVWELSNEDVQVIENFYGPNFLTSGEVRISKGYDDTKYWLFQTDKSQAIKGEE